jgi:hypothetical protein
VPDDQLSARHKESSNRSLRLVVTLVKHLSIANTMPINGFAYGVPHKKNIFLVGPRRFLQGTQFQLQQRKEQVMDAQNLMKLQLLLLAKQILLRGNPQLESKQLFFIEFACYLIPPLCYWKTIFFGG